MEQLVLYAIVALSVTGSVSYTGATCIESYTLMEYEKMVLRTLTLDGEDRDLDSIYAALYESYSWMTRRDIECTLIRLENKQSVVRIGRYYTLA